MAARPKRARNPHGEGNRLRRELIEAAGRVLAATPNGTELSLRAVAREAGVAAPSVYLQFADKADLIGAVLTTNFDQLRQIVEDAIAQETEAAARLRAGCLAYCRFGLEHPGAYRVIFENELHSNRNLGPFGGPGDASARAFQVLVDAISNCMSSGVAPPGDAFRQATLVWTGMHGFLTLARALRGFPWPPVEDQLEDLIVSVVGVPRRQSLTVGAVAPDSPAETVDRSNRYIGGDDA